MFIQRLCWSWNQNMPYCQGMIKLRLHQHSWQSYLLCPLQKIHEACGMAVFDQHIIAWLSLNFILQTSRVALYSVVCLSVCLVTPDQISTFSNIYRHTSPLLTLYHLIPSSINLYWPSTSQYCHILTQYHQVPTYNSSFDESRTVYLV